MAEQIQRELAQIIREELKDPRIGMVTITGVEVTRDMSYAKIFYTLMTGQDKAEETQATLMRSAGFMRSQLSRRITVYKIPELKFAYDQSIENGMQLSHLIDQAISTQLDNDGETE
jgi:ribosome-binding factor A